MTPRRAWTELEAAWALAMAHPSLAHHRRAMRAFRALVALGISEAAIQRRGRRAYFRAVHT
jgi:hypothetical protein